MFGFASELDGKVQLGSDVFSEFKRIGFGALVLNLDGGAGIIGHKTIVRILGRWVQPKALLSGGLRRRLSGSRGHLFRSRRFHSGLDGRTLLRRLR